MQRGDCARAGERKKRSLQRSDSLLVVARTPCYDYAHIIEAPSRTDYRRFQSRLASSSVFELCGRAECTTGGEVAEKIISESAILLTLLALQLIPFC